MWIKSSKRTKEFHESKQAELGERLPGRPISASGKSGWGIKDTAREMKFSIRHVHEDLKLSEYADDVNFKNLSRQEALDKIRGTSTITLEKILADSVRLALIKMVDPLNSIKASEARSILSKAWGQYNDRKYPRGSEKTS